MTNIIQQLNNHLQTKKYFIFDFDRTLAKMEIDWSDWHTGISEVYSKYDPNHGYQEGKNPHTYHNELIDKYGELLLNDARDFNTEYESKYLTGFTPNTELIEFITNTPDLIFHVYSSNAKDTVFRGLKELDILDKIKNVVTKNDVKFVKPNPEGFSLFEGFEENKPLFLMVGDSKSDRNAAQAAGIDFLECTKWDKYIEEE